MHVHSEASPTIVNDAFSQASPMGLQPKHVYLEASPTIVHGAHCQQTLNLGGNVGAQTGFGCLAEPGQGRLGGGFGGLGGGGSLGAIPSVIPYGVSQLPPSSSRPPPW